jgi:hypothetical protein
MIIGVCIAARQESRRFSRIKGYGSKGLVASTQMFIVSQIIMKEKKVIIKVQLPPFPWK